MRAAIKTFQNPNVAMYMYIVHVEHVQCSYKFMYSDAECMILLFHHLCLIIVCLYLSLLIARCLLFIYCCCLLLPRRRPDSEGGPSIAGF